MNYKEAIETIKSNYPDERYTILREALDLAIEVLKGKAKEVEYDKFIRGLTELPFEDKMKFCGMNNCIKSIEPLPLKKE